jgi:hypothetical protein
MAQPLRHALTRPARPLALLLALGACQTLETETPDVISGADASGAGGSSPIGGGGQNGNGGQNTGNGGQNTGNGGQNTGGQGTGGQGNGGTVVEPIGGMQPPPPPDCEALAVTARIEQQGNLTRSDAIEIHYTAPEGTTISAASPEGGLFTQRRDKTLFYSPGGSINGPSELRWPWFTGTVHITVRATDARGCRGEAETSVVVDGDVLVSDASSGGIFALGSDGRVIGRYRQGGVRGTSDLILLPESAGGGFAYATPGYDDDPPTITRLGADGRKDPAQFQMETNAHAPLYPDGSGPQRLIYDAAENELLGDNGYGGAVHRWTLDGAYQGSWDAPTDPGSGPMDRRPMGFAHLADGRIAFAIEGSRDIFTLLGGRIELFARFETGITVFGAGAEDTVIVGGRPGSPTLLVRLDADASEISRAEVSSDDRPQKISPFRSGYLRTEPSSYALVFHTGNLEVPENQDDYWAQDYMNRNGLEGADGFVWLNR